MQQPKPSSCIQQMSRTFMRQHSLYEPGKRLMIETKAMCVSQRQAQRDAVLFLSPACPDLPDKDTLPNE